VRCLIYNQIHQEFLNLFYYHLPLKQQQSANNGEIVVAMTEDDEATVKRFFKETSYFRLQPENSSMEPIIVVKKS